MLSRLLRVGGFGLLCGLVTINGLQAELPATVQQPSVVVNDAANDDRVIDQIRELSKKVTQEEALWVIKNELISYLSCMKLLVKNSIISFKDTAKDAAYKLLYDCRDQAVSRVELCMGIYLKPEDEASMDSKMAAIINSAEDSLALIFQDLHQAVDEKLLIKSQKLPIESAIKSVDCVIKVFSCVDKLDELFALQVKAANELFAPYAASMQSSVDLNKSLATIDLILALSKHVKDLDITRLRPDQKIVNPV